MKVKGFTLNKDASDVMDFKMMKDMVLGTVENVTFNPLKFTITPHHTISSGKIEKVLSFTSNKRTIVSKENGDIYSLPFI